MHTAHRRTAGDIHECTALGVLNGIGSSIFIFRNNPKLSGNPAVAEYALCVASNVGICIVPSMTRLELE